MKKNIFILQLIIINLFAFQVSSQHQLPLDNGNLEAVSGLNFTQWTNIKANGAIVNYSIETIDVPTGSTKALKSEILSLGTNDYNVSRNDYGFEVAAGGEYTVSFYAKTETSLASSNLKLVFQSEKAGSFQSKTIALTNIWQLYTHTFTVASNANANQLKFWYQQAGVTYFIDEVSVVRNYDANKVFSLENAMGIVVDDLGNVNLWENQINGFGDATQSDANLGPAESPETYPGKTTVNFIKQGSFLELEGSSTHISDNNYSIFYVGKANPDGKPASLIGNYDITGSESNCKGIRILKESDGSIYFEYANPNLVHINLGNIQGDGFFFLGFTMDSSGNYSYFDNSSSTITTGNISDTMVPNTEDMNLNLLEEINGTGTYGQTEVVEVTMYNAKLDPTKFQNEYNILATEYADLVVSEAEFKITGVDPPKLNRSTLLSATGNISIDFSANVDSTSEYPKIFITTDPTEDGNTEEATGTWNLSQEDQLTFSPTQNWPANALVSLQIQPELKSTGNKFIRGLNSRNYYDFIVERPQTFITDTIILDQIATVDHPIAGHKLPLKIVTPVFDTNTTERFPVHIWVHGGGWYGGNLETSEVGTSVHAGYLAENLGIVTLDISYRCSGSKGTFSLAREDVQTAYDWAVANADAYNLDMTKVFFSGGSAGSSLAAIAADENDALGFIGFNGMYDFVEDAGDFSEGSNNRYKLNIPSEEANSPILLLSDTPPPTILMHGDADTLVSDQQSILFADAINDKGDHAYARYVSYPGERHGFFNGGKAYMNILFEMVSFITRILDEPTPTNSLITNVTGSDTVLIGDTVNVSVAYESNVTNDIVVVFQRDNDSYTTYNSVRTTVDAGIGTLIVPLPIISTNPSNTSIPVASDDYQYQVFITAVGDTYDNRIHNYSKIDISTTNLFFITNKATGTYLHATDLLDGTLLKTGALQQTDYFKWEKIAISGSNYFHFKNVATGMYFRPDSNSEGSNLVQRPNTWSGDYTRWQEVTSADGEYFYLQNKESSMYFRPTGSGTSSLDIKPTSFSADWTRWSYEAATATGGSSKAIASKKTEDTLLTNDVIKIYPNPIKQNQTLFFDLGQNDTNNYSKLDIYNIQGRLIYSKPINNNPVSIQIDTKFSKGFYIITLSGNNISINKKLIVE